MAMRRNLVVLILAVLPSFGASYRTQNFLVEAQTPQIAERIGQAAEDRFRTAKDLDPCGRARPDAGSHQVERDHRAGGEQGSLIGGNLHASMIVSRPFTHRVPSRYSEDQPG